MAANAAPAAVAMALGAVATRPVAMAVKAVAIAAAVTAVVAALPRKANHAKTRVIHKVANLRGNPETPTHKRLVNATASHAITSMTSSRPATLLRDFLPLDNPRATATTSVETAPAVALVVAAVVLGLGAVTTDLVGPADLARFPADRA